MLKARRSAHACQVGLVGAAAASLTTGEHSGAIIVVARGKRCRSRVDPYIVMRRVLEHERRAFVNGDVGEAGWSVDASI